jgi:citrate lyase subunit beta/citryl-CoA lyase
MPIHPSDALFETGDAPPALPVCDHYCGVEARMRKSLALQAELGPVFDVTLDCEDGAAVGGEVEQAHLAAELINSPQLNRHGRVGVRVHPFNHPAFDAEVETLVRIAGARLAYIMVPKPRHLDDVKRACEAIDHHIRVLPPGRHFPIHALIETHGALRDIDAIAAHPRIESLSFGLMDFVSAHHGAVPRSAMTAEGQFTHPLVRRAKLDIAAACHAHAKVPSHCVVTEFKDLARLKAAADKAAREFGYMRMWSIHPDQIRTIVAAFAPAADEVEEAAEILLAAQRADWAPIRHRDTLHDRASYRYFWQLLQRARSTSMNDGTAIPADAQRAFFGDAAPGAAANSPAAAAAAS